MAGPAPTRSGTADEDWEEGDAEIAGVPIGKGEKSAHR